VLFSVNSFFEVLLLSLHFKFYKLWVEKKLEKRDSLEMNEVLISMFVPQNILKDFVVWDVYGKQGNWIIELREKEDKISKELIDLKEEIVLDGFCNPIEMLSFGFSLGPVYLRIYRRRWKRSNEDKHFSNDYDLQLKGYKLVPGLVIFLKEEDRRLSNKH
jgi:hypothetical protein